MAVHDLLALPHAAVIRQNRFQISVWREGRLRCHVLYIGRSCLHIVVFNFGYHGFAVFVSVFPATLVTIVATLSPFVKRC